MQRKRTEQKLRERELWGVGENLEFEKLEIGFLVSINKDKSGLSAGVTKNKAIRCPMIRSTVNYE